MFKRKLTAPDWVMLTANLVPIAGVLFGDWSAEQVFLAYCLETIIIGIFTLVKLGIATAFRKNDYWENNGKKTLVSGIFFMFFFIVHYGLFVGVQTSIFLSAAKIGNNSVTGSANFFDLISSPDDFLTRQGWIIVIIFSLCYAFEQLTYYIRDKEYMTKPMGEIMLEPYIRIFIQQFTVILGAMALSFGAGILFILIFAAAKTFFTVFLDFEGLKKYAASRQQ
jgi:hypothetical protein